MTKFIALLALALMSLASAGCKSTNSNAARQTLNPEPGVSDGFSGNGNRRGNPVRNAFNTFRY